MRHVLPLLAVLGFVAVVVYAAEVFDPGSTATIIPGTPTFSGLTANAIIYLNAAKIATTIPLTDGKLFVGSTGSVPVAANLTGTVNQVTVTNGPGTITLSLANPINVATSSSAASLSANLPVARLNSGTGASATTYFRGDATLGAWVDPFAAGLTASKVVRDAAGSGTCTLDFTKGLLTGGTC